MNFTKIIIGTSSRVASTLLPLFLTLAAMNSCAADSFNSNGTKIHYVVSGQGNAVVLVHGLLGSSDDWKSPKTPPPELIGKKLRILDELSKDYMVIAVDCRGHGKSGKPHDLEQYGMEMVHDIVRLLDHLQVEKASLVGYSMGSAIAAKVAASHPDRVTSLVLGGGGPSLEGEEDSPFSRFMNSVAESLEAGNGLGPLLTATPPGQPKPTPEQIEQLNKFILADQDPTALARVIQAAGHWAIGKGEIKSNSLPTLAIVGGNDLLRQSVTQKTKIMANTKLIVLEGEDHQSTLFNPEFVSNVQRFLAEHR